MNKSGSNDVAQLRRKVRELEAELELLRDVSKSKEEMLLKLLHDTDEKCKDLERKRRTSSLSYRNAETDRFMRRRVRLRDENQERDHRHDLDELNFDLREEGDNTSKMTGRHCV